MAANSCSLLRSLFAKLPTRMSAAASAATTKPAAFNIPVASKPIPAAINKKTTQPRYVPVEAIVKKFKESSDSNKFRRRNFAYETVVRRLASRKEFAAIRDILDHQKKYPEITEERFAVRLICLYGRARMFDDARKLFDEMPSLNCNRTIVSFNALLGACMHAKEYSKIHKLFEEIPQKLSVVPDIVSYNTVVQALCSSGSADSAMILMNGMSENGVKPDTVTFNTILDAFYKAERFPEAEKLWSLMAEKNVAPDIRSYNTRLRGLVAEKRNSDAVELILNEMRVNGVCTDNYSYNAMIKGFVDSGNVEEAMKWYEEMVANKLSPDRATFGMLLPFLCDKGEFDSAYDLCKKAFNKKQAVYASVVQWIIDGLVGGSKKDEAEELMKLAKFK